MTNWYLVKDQVTSKWASHVPSWIIFASIWCLNSALLLGLGFENKVEFADQLYAALVANLAAWLGVIFTIVIWEKIWRKLTENSPLTLVITLMVGTLVGLTKGFLTYSVFWRIREEDFSTGELLSASFPAALIGFFTIAIFGIAGSLAQDFFHQRDLMVSENVSRRVAQEINWPLENDVKRFITGARNQLAAAGESSVELKKVLIDLAQLGVRPISHKLWQEEKKIGTRFAFRYLFQATVRGHQFPATIMAIATFPMIFPQQLAYFTIQISLINSGAQCLLIYLVFKLGRRIPLTGRVTGPLVFLLTPLVAVLALDTVDKYLLESIPELNRISIGVVFYLGLLSSALLLTTVLNTPRTISEMNAQLNNFDTGSINSEVEKTIKLIKKRETAELLHGYVQNQLMTASLKLSDDNKTVLLIRDSIVDLLASLEAGTLQSAQVRPLTLNQAISSLKEIWSGVMAVEVTSSHFTDQQQNSIGQSTLQLLDRLCNELIANAHRHGLASKIEISLELVNDELILHALDNGIGPRQGKPGLGTALLNAATAGRWVIELGPNQIGAVVSCRIAS